MLDRFQVSRFVVSAAKKLFLAQLLGWGDQGDVSGADSGALTAEDPDGAAEVVDDAPFYQQLGVAARPLVASTLKALGWREGDEVWILKLWDRARTPTDLAEGETRTYACGDITVRARFRTDGLAFEAKGATIEITSVGAIRLTPASGQDIVLGGGSAKVARVGDTTSGHTHTAGGLQVVIPSGPAAGTYPVTGATASSTDTVAAAAGAVHVKA